MRCVNGASMLWWLTLVFQLDWIWNQLTGQLLRAAVRDFPDLFNWRGKSLMWTNPARQLRWKGGLRRKSFHFLPTTFMLCWQVHLPCGNMLLLPPLLLHSSLTVQILLLWLSDVTGDHELSKNAPSLQSQTGCWTIPPHKSEQLLVFNFSNVKTAIAELCKTCPVSQSNNLPTFSAYSFHQFCQSRDPRVVHMPVCRAC